MLEIISIAAIFFGPISAVIITRYIDTNRLKFERRMDIFRKLMRTRRLRLSPDHVEALNLVEIEFSDEPGVVLAWKNYFSHLATKNQNIQSQEELEKLNHDCEALLTKLVHAIAKCLKFKIEQLDIFEGGYAPKGWWDIEEEQRVFRNLMIDLLRGNRGLPITYIINPNPRSPFPPPPSSSKQKDNDIN